MAAILGAKIHWSNVQRASDVTANIHTSETTPFVRIPGTGKYGQSSKFFSSSKGSFSSLSKGNVARKYQLAVKNPRCSTTREYTTLQSKSMEETYDRLAHRLLERYDKVEPGVKYIVGIAGPPGAGKSTVACEVVARLNSLWKERDPLNNEMAVAVPMDGFHLYRWQLDAMEDPGEAHARRGAPWTFDPKSLSNSLVTLREKGLVSLPSFDHGVGDPVEDDIRVEERHTIVLVEGNYLLLKSDDWADLYNLFDERWFIDVDIDEAMKRVENRHIGTGKTPEVAKWRIGYNDRPNAELIQKSKGNADLLIPSLPIELVEGSLIA